MLLSWNYIWGICSGIFAIVFLVLGVVFGKNDSVIDVEPLVWIPSNDDLNYSFHETLVKLINESQESIYIFTQCFDKQISNDLIDILKSRHDNGIDIRLISKSNLSYDFLSFVNISSYKLTSDFFVFDEEKILFICESFSDGWNPITILFKNCKSIAKDVLAFYLLVQKIGEGKINDQTSSHWAHDLLVTENYLNPHTYQSGTIFFTQSLSKKIPPVRDIINETLTHITTIKPNYIKLITSGFVQQYGNQSMFYIQNELMKNGLSNYTNVKILLNSNDQNFKESIRWALSMYRIQNIVIRVTNHTHLYNFIVADETALIGSYPFSDVLFYNSYGITLVSHKMGIYPVFDSIFDIIWNSSRPINEYLKIIWPNAT